MTCRECGRPLPDDARFCSGCGVAIASACAGCGKELESDASFCRHCGRPVAERDERQPEPKTVEPEPVTPPTGRAAGRERKVATLVFADIVGFTAMNEAHDPEFVSSVVSDAFERLAQEVRRYEGTIEKFAGDAMLAVFGVPATHEDDPERAVRAALEMQSVAAAMRAGGEGTSGLELRIGIATGEVLVDQGRASTERDLFVTGDAVNTAARLQAAAEPSAVLVSSTTYAATREAIDYEELPPLVLKGKELPVAVWRAVVVKAGRGGRRARLGLEAPMVGRDAEMALLKETVRRTVEEGRPHLVTVIGNAGVGKSRLTWELEKYLDGLPDVFHWRKGRCLAYSGQSFGPIADVVKFDAHIADDDAPAAARSRLAARLGELHLDATGDENVRWALEAVLAIGDARDRARDELFEAWRRYLDAIAAFAPLVLVVEDIHWADDGVLAFLDFLARWGEGAIVIVCLARHELLERRATWGGGLPNATTIVLEPLSEGASARLMDGLLDGGVPRALRGRIIELAEGNPLFVEEMVRMLVDRGLLRFTESRWDLAGGVEQVQIPDSVQAVLAARLDALPPEEKRTAQDAAVIGRIFWDVIVAYLAGSGRDPTIELIRRLRVKDLVVQRSPSALAEAGEYGFRHVLIRDVAYDSLPKRDRSRLHRDVALWAESQLADRIDEFSELIASHFAAALAYEEEFTEDEADLRIIRELTQVAAQRAARRASAMSQLDVASHWLKLAVDLAWKLGASPRTVADLTLEYAEDAVETDEPAETEGRIVRAIEALGSAARPSDGDAELLARLRDKHGLMRFNQEDVEGSRDVLRAAIEELEPRPPTAGRALLLNRLGWTYWRAGPPEEAVPILERARSEAEATASAPTLRWATHDLGVALAMLGRPDEGLPLLDESYRQARDAGDRGLLLRCYINIPAVRLSRGDPPGTVAPMVEEGLHMARRSAASQTIDWLAANYADIMLGMGRLPEAIDSVTESLQHAQALSDPHLDARLAGRALMRLLAGDVDGASHDMATAERLGLTEEPQFAWSHPLAVAVLEWSNDPHTATRTLSEWVATRVDGPSAAHEAVVALARMAFRLQEEEVLLESVRLERLSRSAVGSTVHDAKTEWVEGLPRGDHRTIASSARTLEELGFRRYAADAWTDAALAAARLGVDSSAGRRARELLAEMGMHPWFGPLPETRWMEPVDTPSGKAFTA